MKENWIEHAKSVALVGLVTLSIVLTGFLWFNAPSYEESTIKEYVPPYVFNDEKYNQKKLYQLAAPYQLIIHHGGKASWVLPESEHYKKLIEAVSKGIIEEQPSLIGKPQPEQWNELFNHSPGVELQFPEDLPVSALDAFFQQSLAKLNALNELDEVSRVWVFAQPDDERVWVWFISDDEQKIVRAAIELVPNDFTEKIAAASQSSPITLTAHPANGKAPWDPANKKEPFSRVFYLPSTPVNMNQLTYTVKGFDIDKMKEWLFKDPAIEPINLSRDEKLYMYNDQLLTYNQKENAMIYSDTSRRAQNLPTHSDRLDAINHFIQKHRGWSGNFLLNTIKTEDEANHYHFRLIAKGYPVYLNHEDAESGHADLELDQIVLEASDSGISKYTRSMLYLSGEPSAKRSSLPGKNQLLSWMAANKIKLDQVERIFPGYQARLNHSAPHETEATLVPAWVIVPENKKPIFFSSP